jgi:hypothetical protein
LHLYTLPYSLITDSKSAGYTFTHGDFTKERNFALFEMKVNGEESQIDDYFITGSTETVDLAPLMSPRATEKKGATEKEKTRSSVKGDRDGSSSSRESVVDEKKKKSSKKKEKERKKSIKDKEEKEKKKSVKDKLDSSPSDGTLKRPPSRK